MALKVILEEDKHSVVISKDGYPVPKYFKIKDKGCFPCYYDPDDATKYKEYKITLTKCKEGEFLPGIYVDSNYRAPMSGRCRIAVDATNGSSCEFLGFKYTDNSILICDKGFWKRLDMMYDYKKPVWASPLTDEVANLFFRCSMNLDICENNPLGPSWNCFRRLEDRFSSKLFSSLEENNNGRASITVLVINEEEPDAIYKIIEEERNQYLKSKNPQ